MKPVLTPRHALPRVFLLRDLLVRQCRGRSKHAVFMARCESKGKWAFYFKTSLLKPVYDLVEFSFKLPLERSVPVIFSSLCWTQFFLPHLRLGCSQLARWCSLAGRNKTVLSFSFESRNIYTVNMLHVYSVFIWWSSVYLKDLAKRKNCCLLLRHICIVSTNLAQWTRPIGYTCGVTKILSCAIDMLKK
jgi:hypothetical protein